MVWCFFEKKFMYKGNIILLGAPGCGKGTLAKQIVNEFDYITISTGDILRETKNADTELGRLLRETLGKGNLVSDEIVNEIVKAKLETISQPFILDGYPRTIPQAEFLDLLTETKLVVYLSVSDEVIEKRILERGKTSNREDDMSVDIIQKRIVQFKKETEPLIKYYSDKNILAHIHGEMSINEVFENFKQVKQFWGQSL
jgi:adenylate kinase